MKDHVTFVRPDGPFAENATISAALPHDLLEQVRSRVRLLALLILIAFAFDPVVFFGTWITASLFNLSLPEDFLTSLAFQWINLGAVAASAALWWVARSSRVSPSRLHTLGLVYEVVICFIIAFITFWQYYAEYALVPNLTWVPAVVILFPLLLPGPPRRMLGAALVAGSMSPFALAVLELIGKVDATLDDYSPAVVSSAFAVVFAYMGARVVYGLGRQVTAARQLGSYRLEECLGRGGMGEVWRARHHMLARPAAIKLIRPTRDGVSGASTAAIQRFEREAQAIASLRSPHTVVLFDFGVADDGAFYYVMELLDGLDADALVRRFGPLPPERAIHLVRQICESLSEAHSCGLIHRDIKPANIFLCRYGEAYDFVKVLDFGLVKTLDTGVETNLSITATNAVHGTPAFIAPEQALGQSDLDGRADIYATGCVAYWMVTGQPVFAADTPMGLVMHHAHSTPSPPSTRTDQPIPAELDRLILACLAKDPADRPQSARALSHELGAIAVATGWTEERAQTWWAALA